MREKLNLRGQRFWRLVVVEEAGRDKFYNALWKCKCDCGNEVIVRGMSLVNGDTRSCGCIHLERITKHGLIKSNPRLYCSVRLHFQYIQECRSGYRGWLIDTRYSHDMEGVSKFCRDLIALQPDACARYEVEKSLDLDKDNDAENIFRPESIVFRTASENRSKKYNNLKLDDGCLLVVFCRRVGVPTRGNGGKSYAYRRISDYYRNHHSAHPELVEKANDTVLVMRQCVEMLKLLDDVKAFKAQYLIP